MKIKFALSKKDTLQNAQRLSVESDIAANLKEYINEHGVNRHGDVPEFTRMIEKMEVFKKQAIKCQKDNFYFWIENETIK